MLDRDENAECQLTRKDTPHHLKHAKIVNSYENEDRVQEIMKNLQQKRKSDGDECDQALADADRTAAKVGRKYKGPLPEAIPTLVGFGQILIFGKFG